MPRRQSSRAAQTWHRYHVYNDPDFIAEVKALPKRKLPDSFDDYDRLAEEYDIDADDVDFIHERDWSDFDPNKNISGNNVSYTQRGDRFVASLNLHITKEQILDVYEDIRYLRNIRNIPDKKYKKPADTELLYAIFKSRKSNRTFKDIFADYQSGKLPFYADGPRNQYSSEDELEKYYRTHYT